MKQPEKFSKAPRLEVSQWFNTSEPMNLEKLLGRVVVIEAFQMLCPGCVSHGIPQSIQIHDTFPRDKVVVLGLHTVFEHHAAMTPVSLEAFLHEYRIGFPVGVDMAGDNAIPRTMMAYQLRGTPSLLLVDSKGNLRAHHFGQVSDMIVGAEIATLLADQG
jgi:hypothetical protein